MYKQKDTQEKHKKLSVLNLTSDTPEDIFMKNKQ